jgi:hypothetical protein
LEVRPSDTPGAYVGLEDEADPGGALRDRVDGGLDDGHDLVLG